MLFYVVLLGLIKSGLSYSFVNKVRLPLVSFEPSAINSRLSCFITHVDGYSLGVCKWVSPKRTRSYPYARLYDVMSQDVSKKVAVVPVVKDEGQHGDRDFLQWDTISLLSLLGVYLIPAYYCDADITQKSGLPKLTNQKFDAEYVASRLRELAHYKYDALHWNLRQVEVALEVVIKRAYECYNNLSKRFNLKMHGLEGIEDYERKLKEGLNVFKEYSRKKAISAQRREIKTNQPKERLSVDKKMPITIQNYLGGAYHFTVDEVEVLENKIRLIEAKHTKSKLLPSIPDIKDGLIKIMLYKSIDELFYLTERKEFEIVLKLTTEVKTGRTILENINLYKGRSADFYKNLLKEAELNNFIVEYYEVN